MVDVVKISLSPHAKIRAEERGVSEEDIQQVLDNPIDTIFANDRGRWKSYGKIVDKYSKVEKYLIVVHTNYNPVTNMVTVISVIVTNKEGLHHHGFG